MGKLIGITLLVITVGTPALAQSYQTGKRFGHWSAGRVTTTTPARVHSRARYRGEQSYALSPRRGHNGYFNFGDTG
jgi:hypothetical protein